MASGCDPGRAGCQIKIRCLKPELLSSLEDFEDMTDSQLLERTLVTQNNGATSPLSSLHYGYYKDDLDWLTQVTSLGGNSKGHIIVVLSFYSVSQLNDLRCLASTKEDIDDVVNEPLAGELQMVTLNKNTNKKKTCEL